MYPLMKRPHDRSTSPWGALATLTLGAALVLGALPSAPSPTAPAAAAPAPAQAQASGVLSSQRNAGATGTVGTAGASGLTASIASGSVIKVGKNERLTLLVNLRTGAGATYTARLAAADKIAKSRGASRKVSWSQLSTAVYVMPAGASHAKATAAVAALRASASVYSAGISGRVVNQPGAVSRVNTSRKPAASIGAIAKQARSIQANKKATGKGITVGVADEGVFDENPAVKGRVVTSYGASCLDGGRRVDGAAHGRPNVTLGGHGTAVANVIVGSPTTGPSRGIAPGAKVASVRVVTAAGHIYPEASICAQLWAVSRKLPILNMSYGVDWAGTLSGGVWDPKNKDHAAVIAAMKRSQAYANSRGVLTVAAAGNDGADFSDKANLEDSETGRSLNNSMVSLPAELPGVVVASMTKSNLQIDRYSTVGYSLVDVAAQGTATLAYGRTGFDTVSGTSFASPAVAGTAALIKQRHPTWKPATIANKLRSSATRRTCVKAGSILSKQPCRAAKGRTSFFGYGVLNAEAAVK